MPRQLMWCPLTGVAVVGTIDEAAAADTASGFVASLGSAGGGL